MSRLIVDRVVAGYGAVTVLREVSLEVGEGEFVALLGVNGNGKSTLLNCILGFVRPRSGRILLETQGKTVDLLTCRPHQITNLGIASVPEGRKLVPNLTVEENLLLAGGGPRGRKDMQANLEFCFQTFPILQERRRQYSSTLSGGQQQLLAIARALMTSPEIMVIDEPSVGLAPIVVNQVISAIRKLQELRSLTILMAEQSFFQAVEVASRAYILSHGKIIREFNRRESVCDSDIRSAMMGVI
ncbi:ABC transporter ATP-binding protein [Bradyrhizobium sp.]|uniref:ABC transporter ATP-binding protein n=1 Tax=Bradyrhizobium sp. TaxID=376 RepID=UPI003C779583